MSAMFWWQLFIGYVIMAPRVGFHIFNYSKTAVHVVSHVTLEYSVSYVTLEYSLTQTIIDCTNEI